MVCSNIKIIVVECPKCYAEAFKVELLEGYWTQTEWGKSHHMHGVGFCQKCGHIDQYEDDSI